MKLVYSIYLDALAPPAEALRSIPLYGGGLSAMLEEVARYIEALEAQDPLMENPSGATPCPE